MESFFIEEELNNGKPEKLYTIKLHKNGNPHPQLTLQDLNLSEGDILWIKKHILKRLDISSYQDK